MNSIKDSKALAAIMAALFMCQPVWAQGETTSAETVHAVFIGYEEDDLIFRIVNQGATPIIIKGLAFNRQILYRPIEKNAVVSPASEEKPFTDILFRTMGDFVWSQNHMNRFRLVYQMPESLVKYYVEIYPPTDQHEE